MYARCMCVKTLDFSGRAQQPGDGVEGNLRGVRLAEDGEHFNTTGGGLRSNFAHETALTDTRRTHDADHSAVAVYCAIQQALDSGHLPTPTDQIRLERARQRDAALRCPAAAGRALAHRHP